MVRTDQAYINQYLVYDEVFEACEACEKACVEADYFLRKEARKSYLDTYFSEALNFGAKKSTSKTEDNVFAKIGKAIVNLIEKIKNAIKHIKDSIFGTQKKTEAANKALQKIFAENPEMKKTIMKGIKKEWFTIYDVAAYKNDIMGLIKMVDQAKIDNQTAMDKFQDMTDKVKKGIVTGAAITGGLSILKGITEINKSRTSLQSTMEAMQHMAEAIKDDTTNKGKDPHSISTKARILGGAVKVLIGLDKNYETNAEKAAKAAEEQAKVEADVKAKQKDADDAEARRRNDESYQWKVDAHNREVARNAADDAARQEEAKKKEEEARKKAETDAYNQSVDATNSTFIRRRDAAQSAINDYNKKVELYVNYAASQNCTSTTDSRYISLKNDVEKAFNRISDTYSDFVSGGIRDSMRIGFIGRVDRMVTSKGNKMPGVHDIEDTINYGQRIVFNPSGKGSGNKSSSSNGNSFRVRRKTR